MSHLILGAEMLTGIRAITEDGYPSIIIKESEQNAGAGQEADVLTGCICRTQAAEGWRYHGVFRV